LICANPPVSDVLLPRLSREYFYGASDQLANAPPPELIRSFASSRFVKLKELLGYKSRDSI
jgi:hypothetical protein